MSQSGAAAAAEADNKTQSDSLTIFSREVRNLLRSKPNCMIPFSKFVPAYHNHYGRQCCVYQFGYTKLIELLESIPAIVQIVGDGSSRYITLTHREQIKRFASDLIKVVKSQPGKKLKLSQFARAYEQVLGRVFRVEDYGTNNINVLLAEIWEGTINIMPVKRELADLQRPLYVHTGPQQQPEQSPPPPPPQPSSPMSLIAAVQHQQHQQHLRPHQHHFRPASNPNQAQQILQHLQQQQQHRQAASSLASTNSDTCDSSAGGSLCSSPSASSSSAATATATAHAAAAHPGQASHEHLVFSQLVAANQPVGKPYITEHYPDAWFEIPKRERSDKEIKRTKYFIWDVVELLSTMGPHYSVPFSKFIPSYHYYFNRQCKVSIFGFSKLIDLFESIAPEVVEILDQGPGEEKLIKLAPRHIPSNKRSSRMAAILDMFKYSVYQAA